MDILVDQVWFIIWPDNAAARKIIRYNESKRSIISSTAGVSYIRVGFDGSFDPDTETIMSIGRNKACDIVCEESWYSRSHCRFVLLNNYLVFRDESSSQTSHIWPQKFSPIENWNLSTSMAPRQRVILEEGIWELGVGNAKFHIHFPPKSGHYWFRNLAEKAKLAARAVAPDRKLSCQIVNNHTPATWSQIGIPIPRVPESRVHNPIIYHHLEDLGSGGFGRVSRVIDIQYGYVMAVKTLISLGSTEKEEMEKKADFKREVEMLANLSHPHIVKFVHSQGWEMGKPVEIFMFAARGSLRSLMQKIQKEEHRALTHAEISRVNRQVFSALNYIHQQGIIHRDLKPENILYSGVTERTCFYITDFGLSKKISPTATRAGSPFYEAPEICLGEKQGTRLDVWSYGVVIYEMLTGCDFGKLTWLPSNDVRNGQWCFLLEYLCSKGGDIAKMLTAKPHKRITVAACCDTEGFPRLPDSLPLPGFQHLFLLNPELTQMKDMKKIAAQVTGDPMSTDN